MLRNQYTPTNDGYDSWNDSYDSWNNGYDNWNDGYDNWNGRPSNQTYYPSQNTYSSMKKQEEEIPNTWNLKPQTMKKIHRVLIVLCVLLVLDAIWLVIELFQSGILG